MMSRPVNVNMNELHPSTSPSSVVFDIDGSNPNPPPVSLVYGRRVHAAADGNTHINGDATVRPKIRTRLSESGTARKINTSANKNNVQSDVPPKARGGTSATSSFTTRRRNASAESDSDDKSGGEGKNEKYALHFAPDADARRGRPRRLRNRNSKVVKVSVHIEHSLSLVWSRLVRIRIGMGGDYRRAVQKKMIGTVGQSFTQIQIMQNAEWRKEWRGLLLPPSSPETLTEDDWKSIRERRTRRRGAEYEKTPELAAPKVDGSTTGNPTRGYRAEQTVAPPNAPKISSANKAVQKNGVNEEHEHSSESAFGFFHLENQPSIPLYPLLLGIVFYHLVKQYLPTPQKRFLLARKFKQKIGAMRYGGNSGQFVVRRDELEAHIRMLKKRAARKKMKRDRGGSVNKDIGWAEDADDGSGDGGRMSTSDKNEHDANERGAGGSSGNVGGDGSRDNDLGSRNAGDGTSHQSYNCNSYTGYNKVVTSNMVCSECSRKTKELKSAQKRNKQLASKINALDAQSKMYFEANVILTKQVFELKEEQKHTLAKLEGEVEGAKDLMEENMILNEKLKDLHSRNLKLEEEIEETMDEGGGYQQQLAEAQGKNKALVAQVTSLKNEAVLRTNEFQADKELLGDKILKLERENEAMDKEIERIMCEFDATAGNNSPHFDGDELELAMSQGIGSSGLLSLTEDEADDSGDDSDVIENLRCKLSDLQARHDSLRAQYEGGALLKSLTSIDRLQNELTSAKAERDAANLNLSQLREQLLLSHRERFPSNDIPSDSDEDLASLHMNESFHTLRIEKEEMGQRLAELQSKLHSKDIVIEGAKLTFDEAEKKVNALEAKIAAVQQELDTATTNLKDEKRVNQELERQMKDAQVELLQLTKERERLVKECKVLQTNVSLERFRGATDDNLKLSSQLEVATAKCATLESKLMECTRKLSYASNDGQNFMDIITQLGARFQEKVEETNPLNRQIEQFASEISALVHERDELPSVKDDKHVESKDGTLTDSNTNSSQNERRAFVSDHLSQVVNLAEEKFRELEAEKDIVLNQIPTIELAQADPPSVPSSLDEPMSSLQRAVKSNNDRDKEYIVVEKIAPQSSSLSRAASGSKGNISPPSPRKSVVSGLRRLMSRGDKRAKK